jgi:hypothetical protein
MATLRVRGRTGWPVFPPAAGKYLAAGAVAAGLGLGWLTAGHRAALAGAAVVLAAVNGYSKAYSP